MSTSNHGKKDQNLHHQQQSYPAPTLPLHLQQPQKNSIQLIPCQMSNRNYQRVIYINHYLATRDRIEHN